MADEVVGSARVTIEPDMGGFEDQLLSEVTAAAEAASAALQSAFESAAQQAADSLGVIGQSDGFTEASSAADEAASAIESSFAGVGDAIGTELDSGAQAADSAAGAVGSSFDGVGDQIASDLAAGASEADAALSGIGQGAGDEVAGEFIGIGDQIANDLEAGASAADSALSGIGAGAGDQITGEFSGVGTQIEAEVAGGSNAAEAALEGLGVAGGGVVASLTENFQGLGGVIAGVAGAVGLVSLLKSGERINTIANITNQLIETTGGVANVTSQSMRELGDSIEETTAVESELVQESGNVLLTFRNVRNEVGANNDIFDRAIKAGVDLSTVLGTDITGASIQLGKALQDPVLGATALSRAGVTFTQQQRDLIRTMVESNNILGAQKLILDELEGQVQGAGVAAADASDKIVNEFGKIKDEIALGLLPAADSLATRLPGVVEGILPTATAFGETLGDAIELAIDALLAFEPALGTTLELVNLALPVLDAAVGLIDAIPGPVLEAAATLYTLNRAVRLLTASSTLGAVSRLGSGLASLVVPAGAVSGAFSTGAASATRAGGAFRSLGSAIKSPTGVLAAGAVAFTLYNNVMDDARASGTEFAQSARADFDIAGASIEELEAKSGRLTAGIEQLRDAKSGGLSGFTIDRDFNAELEAGAKGLEEFKAEVDAAAKAAKEAAAEDKFGALIRSMTQMADQSKVLSDESVEVRDSIRGLQFPIGDTQDEFLDLAIALDSAALSEEGMAAAASLLGTDVESLQGFVEEANTALNEFADTAIGQLPTVADAFANVGEDSILSAREFIEALNLQTVTTQAFVSNLKVITEAGFADLAGVIAEQGPTIGGALATELSTALQEGNTEIVEESAAAVELFNTTWTSTTEYLRTELGPEFVLTTGLIGSAATTTFGENIDFGERLRIAGALAQTELDEQGQAIAAIAATEGALAAREYGRLLDIDGEVVEEAIKAGEAIKNNNQANDYRTAGDAGGRAYGDGVRDGIGATFSRVFDKVRELVREARAAAAAEAKEGSPSKLFATLGENISLGVAMGIDSEKNSVVDAAERIVRDAARATEDAARFADGSLLSVGGSTLDVTGAFTPGGLGGVQVTIESGAIVMRFEGPVDDDTVRRVREAGDDLLRSMLPRLAENAARLEVG